jgi:TAG lipase / lysophosphatidylethanolamine acyltransferase
LKLKAEIEMATGLGTWKELNQQLDELEGNDKWKEREITRTYDYKLIKSRLQNLRAVSETEGISSMMFLLRAGLIRNLGGIGKSNLYQEHCHIGTKSLIETYIDEVVNQIDRITWTEEEEITDVMKIDYFSDVLQSFGRTALIFHGGASFGLCHLGVAKGLFDLKMLPKVICGSYIGALIAGLICSKSPEELEILFNEVKVDLTSFENQGSFKRKLLRLLKHGRLFDIKVVEDCAKQNIGDITFKVNEKKMD